MTPNFVDVGTCCTSQTLFEHLVPAGQFSLMTQPSDTFPGSHLIGLTPFPPLSLFLYYL